MSVDLRKGDCNILLKEVPDKSVNLIVTDPPYDVSVNHDGGKLYHNKGFDKSNEELVSANINNGYDIVKFGEEVKRIMKHINVYFWCNKKQIPQYFDYYVNGLGCKFEILCWHKTNALPTFNGKYLTDTEYCLYFFEEGHKFCDPSNYEDAKTFFYAPINNKDKKMYGHPTIKPLDMVEKLIRNSSRKDDVVLDPFMGSGTTGVASVLLNRNFIGMEIDEHFFDVARKRIESYTSQPKLKLE